ncbi:hypothetical protein F503_04039 [Ophiostoma piceae UAMH 11346]|uniref:Mfs multidrug transporter n=1 Tax=Ophiostoma piceae (strain UAMH 11346) TaxID=1262450 RepID=S3CQ28_OPHP1|nr:hypothetical protein F503_04039 [Ophiostoma piceae UAMH 11346]
MPPRPNFSRVPTIAQVVPGAHVSIVLKQDQPTGRTVQGMVQNVLTRGNHPRGIKVRLSDGRVGRVQTMGDIGNHSGSQSLSAVLSQSIPQPTSAPDGTSFYPARGVDDDAPTEQLGLDAYIKPAKTKQNKKRGGAPAQTGAAASRSRTPPPTLTTTTTTTATTTCPVCGDFEGDEAAVSHHVSSHFDS